MEDVADESQQSQATRFSLASSSAAACCCSQVCLCLELAEMSRSRRMGIAGASYLAWTENRQHSLFVQDGVP